MEDKTAKRKGDSGALAHKAHIEKKDSLISRTRNGTRHSYGILTKTLSVFYYVCNVLLKLFLEMMEQSLWQREFHSWRERIPADAEEPAGFLRISASLKRNLLCSAGAVETKPQE